MRHCLQKMHLLSLEPVSMVFEPFVRQSCHCHPLDFRSVERRTQNFTTISSLSVVEKKGVDVTAGFLLKKSPTKKNNKKSSLKL